MYIMDYALSTIPGRVWCRLSCGHDLLVLDRKPSNMLLGLAMPCLACAVCEFDKLLPEVMYVLYLKDSPCTGRVVEFIGYRSGPHEVAYFECLEERDSPRWEVRKEDVAAIEKL